MILLGVLHIAVAVVGLWLTGGGRAPKAAWVWKAAVWSFPLSLAAMIVGWVFTEMGRQPWLVFGLLKTADGVSPGVSGLEVLISLAAFTAIYGSLAVVEFRLILKAVKKGPDAPAPTDEESGDVRHPATVY
jgi:cytochrome d ubiquinol oxidase subunit I